MSVVRQVSDLFPRPLGLSTTGTLFPSRNIILLIHSALYEVLCPIPIPVLRLLGRSPTSAPFPLRSVILQTKPHLPDLLGSLCLCPPELFMDTPITNPSIHWVT